MVILNIFLLRREEFQQKIITEITKNFFKGRKSSILLYGAKRSGKTFMIRGNETINSGILQSVFKEIYHKLKKKSKKIEETAEISIYMVYKNEIFDLLQVGGRYKRGVEEGLKTKSISCKEDLVLALHQALNARKILSCEEKNLDLKRKAHLVIRVSLSEEMYDFLLDFSKFSKKKKRKKMLKIEEFEPEINIVELADANFVKNKEIKGEEMEFLHRDFNELFDCIVESYTKYNKICPLIYFKGNILTLA